MYKLKWEDLVRLLKSYEFINDFDAEIIATYLKDKVNFEYDLSYYIWDVVPYEVTCLKGGRDEALEYIDKNLSCTAEECIIYEVKKLNGVTGTYLEWFEKDKKNKIRR